MKLAEVERAKYENVWQFDEYKKDESQSDKYVDAFFELCEPEIGNDVIDLGCGAGNGGLKLKERGLDVSWLDLTDVALLPEIDRDNFIATPLWKWRPPVNSYYFGYCCEVMEHIPQEYVMLCAANILRACNRTFFTICNRLDTYGPQLLGEPLHLTVRPFVWWLNSFEEIGTVHDARDLCGQSLFVVGV